MYRLITVKDIVRIPPSKFAFDPKEVAKEELKLTYEGIYDRDEGVVLSVLDVKELSKGVIVPGDGATYHEAVFDVLVWRPELHEVVEGEVVDITQYGAFIRIGPLDGLVHISQISEERVEKVSDKLTEGDVIRVKVLEVDKQGRIRLSMKAVNE